MGVEWALIDEAGRRAVYLGKSENWLGLAGWSDFGAADLAEAARLAWETPSTDWKPHSMRPAPEWVAEIVKWIGDARVSISVDPGSRWDGDPEPCDDPEWGSWSKTCGDYDALSMKACGPWGW